MSPARENLQHAPSVRTTGGFSQDVTIADDTGIGAEHDQRIVRRISHLAEVPDSLCLFLRKPLNIRGSDLMWQTVFVDFGGLNSEAEASLCE